MEKINPAQVFGDQRLFDGAPEECFCVARNAYGDRIFYKAECGALFWLYNDEWKPLQVMSCTPLAMRRIIKTPVWTVADQKEGRLPEVGSIFTYRDETLTCHFIDGDGEIWAHDIDNKIVTPLLRDCRPIETPAEKAQRLEDEFFEQVKLEGMNANTPQKTSSLFELGVRIAYRKHLELTAPKGGE